MSQFIGLEQSPSHSNYFEECQLAKVCESCMNMAREESEGYGISPSLVAKQYGAEISDHICDARDNGKPCGCACNR